WREITAREENQPRKWILPDHTLLELARQMPADREGLAQIKGINDRLLQQHGAKLLEISGPG
ncbi:MAG: HRDC domain-containing protein, partial [Gammaproteobacteria bacterium]